MSIFNKCLNSKCNSKTQNTIFCWKHSDGYFNKTDCACCGNIELVKYYSDEPFSRFLCERCYMNGGMYSSLIHGITYYVDGNFVKCSYLTGNVNKCTFTCLSYLKKFNKN